MFKVIHISDLHLENEKNTNGKTNIINALALDFQNIVDENTILCFTGDLINKGGTKFENKEDAYIIFETLFIDKIIELNPLLKGKIFIVPGNHDINRDRIDDISEAGLKTSLNEEIQVNEFIIKNRINSNHLDRIKLYNSWQKDFYLKYNKTETSNFDNSFNIKLGNQKVGVCCLNSAWLCKDDNDMGGLLIGKEQIEHSLKKISGSEIKIALVHHPIEFLQKFDRDSVNPLLYKNFNILVTGHVHELDANYTQNLFGNLFVSIANSTIGDSSSDKKLTNGYTIIEYTPKEKFKVFYRKYVEIHNRFVPNTDIGTDDGSKTFKILLEESLNKFSQNQALITSIESRYCDQLNDHIIMTDDNTSTKCTIENLFVEPTIINSPQDSLKKEDTIRYKIDDLLKESSNFLIYGMKESGKTILLDKLFIESVKCFNIYNRIPVLLKYGQLKNRKPKTIIKEFVGMPDRELENYLESTQILLLIDDIYFNGNTPKEIEELKNYLIKYPRTRIIATSTQILENVIPTEYLKHNSIFNFNLAFIQNFSTAEIKQLITNWFNGREVDLQENMQKLIKSFGDYGLPRTPLSITLFLWIFEKQEKKPINSSILVEMFIENLLEKTKIENIYSETFGFKNKKRLLSFISKFMKDSGNSDLNYCVDYVELLDFMNSYLKTRFTGKPQKVLEDFVKRGILCHEEDNTIRFKSAFFFTSFLHYFLIMIPLLKKKSFLRKIF